MDEVLYDPAGKGSHCCRMPRMEVVIQVPEVWRRGEASITSSISPISTHRFCLRGPDHDLSQDPSSQSSPTVTTAIYTNHGFNLNARDFILSQSSGNR